MLATDVAATISTVLKVPLIVMVIPFCCDAILPSSSEAILKISVKVMLNECAVEAGIFLA
jgi:hypothetical protein